MSNLTNTLASSLGLSGGEYIAAGETATAPNGRKIAFLLPLGGDATLSAISNCLVTDFPSDAVLAESVAYPAPCDSVTLAGGSAGGLIVYYI